jgi:hypothetical protein
LPKARRIFLPLASDDAAGLRRFVEGVKLPDGTCFLVQPARPPGVRTGRASF